ncbi:MAG: hypothetical protein JNJ61_01440 [Anaerolineae bacterium]|nr:hypothetical protein [Anaerolineae bacterium]
MLPTLIATKLHIPRPRAAQIERPALLAALEAGSERKLILVAAAAGCGKTALLAEWCAAHSGEACWLSLDAGDNDPARFLLGVLAALRTCRPELGAELLAALSAPQPPPLESALHSLLNQLAEQPRTILVLDDYHVIENPAIHAAMTLLLDHLPPQITLALATRSDPPLPLGRLRARRDLLELRADDLRFSPDESAAFLNSLLNLGLSDAALRTLDARTEGWAAGLQLAALAMPAPAERESFVRQFGGSHRFVLDYLLEEVLAQQPDDVRHFLLRTSFLRRMNAGLCAAVSGQADGAALLDHIERHNLFLIALDGERRWYRYHHLFADLLLTRLRAESPGLLPELRGRAARWLADNDLPEEAVPYALEAGNFALAGELISAGASGITRRAEVATLLDWYRQFPPDFISQHPLLALQFALGFALNGRWQEALALRPLVDSAAPQPDEALLLRYLINTYQQDAAELARVAAVAAERPPSAITHLVRGMSASAMGDFQSACAFLTQATAAADHAGQRDLALNALFNNARLRVFLGDLHEAHALSTQALAYAGALPAAAVAHTALCRIHIEWNELDAADAHALQAIQIAERSGFRTGLLSSATLMRAEVQQAHGDHAAALATVEQALRFAEQHDPPPEVTWLRVYRARIWLAQGSPAVVDWLREAEDARLPLSLFYPPAILPVTLARALLSRRRIDAAVALLTRLTGEARGLLTVEALALLALARQMQGDPQHALLALGQALALAEPERRVRAFLDLGEPLAALLARYCDAHPEADFARALLAAFPESPPPALEPLHAREVEILRLIVAGHSNEEIAAQLVLALSTVKWYINALYAKLHVKTRSQAIARAHALRLLE